MANLYGYNGSTISITPAGDSLRERNYYCIFSLFEKIGVIGDSYANGYCGEASTDSSGVNHPEISWPKQLERWSGATVSNYSRGGQSSRSFIDTTDDRYSQWGMGKLLADVQNGNTQQLYIFALGRNDFNIIRNAAEGSTDASYLGSITDITGNSLGSYPDTFYGNTATLLETVMNAAPKALIVMMTLDYSPNSAGYVISTAIKAIAEHYGLPCMDQRDDPYFQGDNSYYREFPAGGHPAAIAYSGMVPAIERLFQNCVRDNKAYFMYYTGVTSTT